MTKVYGGFKKGSKNYSYGAVMEDFDTIRAEIVVDNIEEGVIFMTDYFGKDIGNKFFEWSYRDAMTHERREELKGLISKAVAEEAVVEEEEEEEEEEEVLCSCGHRVPKSIVMVSSTGSCCPECYDRMSL